MGYSYNDSTGIQYSKLPSEGTKGLNFKPIYGDKGENDYSYTQTNPSKFEFKPCVNAVELDWNGAKIDELTVNTTGELLVN